MDLAPLSPHGDTSAFRRLLVETALRRVRARGVEPQPALLALYERYVLGEITPVELEALLDERLRVLLTRLAQQMSQQRAFNSQEVPDAPR